MLSNISNTAIGSKEDKKYSFLLSYNYLLITLFISLIGCKKIIEIDPPANSITTSIVFSSDGKANSAVAGLYTKMINAGSFDFFSGALTVFPGMSADELINVHGVNYQVYYQFNINTLQQTNGQVAALWNSPYSVIYGANAIISGLQSSNSVGDSVKKVLTGEAKFIRALSYFYLVNLFGDVPLVTTINYHQTSGMSRTPMSEVYNTIISDLKDAVVALPEDYSISGGERIRANKWAALALLARVYLFAEDWVDAENCATAIISNNISYDLVSNLNDVFLKNSSEAILQLQRNGNNFPFGTIEGLEFIPANLTRNYPPHVVAQFWHLFVPPFYFTDELANAFEPSDQRLAKWTDSTGLLNGRNYYYPFKYKIRGGTAGSVTEYYTILRLAEQYLIRGEARAQLGKISEAQGDLNIIRARAGLGNTTANDKLSLLDAIFHERQVELFAELGHRWLDMKRYGKADAIIGPLKAPAWQTTDQLYPIPLSELIADPNLTQNPGY